MADGAMFVCRDQGGGQGNTLNLKLWIGVAAEPSYMAQARSRYTQADRNRTAAAAAEGVQPSQSLMSVFELTLRVLPSRLDSDLEIVPSQLNSEATVTPATRSLRFRVTCRAQALRGETLLGVRLGTLDSAAIYVARSGLGLMRMEHQPVFIVAGGPPLARRIFDLFSLFVLVTTCID